MIQVRLGSRRKLDVPNLDVENRWNSMFEMVKNCYDLRHVFESLCNTDEFQNILNDLKLSDLYWRELKSVTDFLEVVEKYTTASSGQSYATLSMQPLIYDSLVSHCRDTIDGRARTGFTTLACQNAAQSVLDKVKKYESYLCSPLTRLGQILDPGIGNGSGMALDMKQTIRDIFVERCDFEACLRVSAFQFTRGSALYRE
jgi:hypothetical protein